MRDVRTGEPRRVALLGSESTGKTTLARRLAERFATVWVPEYARSYAVAKGAPLDAPLDTTSPISWVGYANPTLAALARPVLQRLVAERFS